MNFPPDEPMFAGEASGPSDKTVPSAKALEILYVAQRLYGAADVLPIDVGNFVRGEAHALSQIARCLDRAD